MHEFSICASLLKQVTRLAQQQQHSSISQIHLTLGPLSGIDAHLLRQAFGVCQRNTLAHHAELTIEVTDIIVYCPHCDRQSKATLSNLLCPHCQHTAQLVSGNEFQLERVGFATHV